MVRETAIEVDSKAVPVVSASKAKESDAGSDNNDDQAFDSSSFANDNYVRTGKYHSASQTSDNLTFIGNYGGDGR